MFEPGERANWETHGDPPKPVTILRRARIMGYWGEVGRIVREDNGRESLAHVDDLSESEDVAP